MRKFYYIATGEVFISETEKFLKNVVDKCDLSKMFYDYVNKDVKFGEAFPYTFDRTNLGIRPETYAHLFLTQT